MTKFLMSVIYTIGSMLSSAPKKEVNKILMPAVACGTFTDYDPCDPYAFDAVPRQEFSNINVEEPLYVSDDVQDEEDCYIYSDPSEY